jgi:hypothetical protein
MKKNKLPNLVFILILTLVTSIIWVSLSTYRAFTTKPTESVSKEISNPINLTLDKTEIQRIEAGIFFDSTQVVENVVNAPLSTSAVIPTLAPLPTPVSATSSAVPTATSSATP